MRFQKALFMSNFGIDMGLPEFRVGSYATYLLPFSKVFEKATGGECKFLLGSHTLDLLNRKSKITEINAKNSFVVRGKEYASLFGLGDDFLLESYNDAYGEKEERYVQYFKKLFGDWQPDVIFCWEFPTTLFRRIFPKALVLDIMPGAYMRPPYPKTISVDPVGLYASSFLKNYDDSQNFDALGDTNEFLKIRDLYSHYFNYDTDVKDVILDLVDPARKFEKYWLVPMQISGYFGFYENCKYKDQFEFLTDVLEKAPKNVGVIATQYIGSLVSEKTLNNRNLGYIRNLYQNFLYSTEFEKLDNISQYIAPWADSVITVSSTLGFQALLHEKKLISPSTSHLSYISSGYEDDARKPDESLIASLFCRQNILVEKLLNDVDYFKAILVGLDERKSDSAIDVLSALPRPANLYKDYLSYSPFSGADNQIKKMGGIISSKKNSLRSLIDRIEKYDVVSFDIFDTLLRRTVFKPEDVFVLIQKKLENEHKDLLPTVIVKRFPELRVGFERQLRKEYDQLHHSTDVYAEKNEEFYSFEIYQRMLAAFGLHADLADRLLNIEQEVEFSVLEARSLGKALYDVAIAKGKRVLLISDFTHTESFVNEAITQAGYVEHEKLYVSSEIGLKKHSGNLFKHVIADLDIKPESILHIGDNSTGDFLRAINNSIFPTKILSTRERINQVFKNRKIDLTVFDQSFYLRTAANLYAEEYYDALLVAGDKPVDSAKEKRDLFSTPGEFGFLAIGPVIYEFTKWILDNALEKKCKKVLFFARDCFLPYEVAKRLVQSIEKYRDLQPVYLAVSRKALTCLNLHQPDDCFKVRIDDFSRHQTLAELLSSRFRIDASRVGEKHLKKWNIDGVQTLIKDTTLGAIYGLVHEYLKDDWKAWDDVNGVSKDAFRAYLEENDVNGADDVVAVDFGYKGSAHSVVSEYFSNKFIPLFFMTYNGEMGNDPYPDAKAYLFNNMNVRHKTCTPLISHNLIIETIINEPLGSLSAYKLIDGQVYLEREEFESDMHKAKIRAIHNGVLNFSDLWIQKIEPLDATIKLESNSATYLMTQFFSYPENIDLEILRGLVFDNAFAGADNTYILSPRGANEKDIWKEGLTLVKKNAKPTNAVSAAATNVKNITTAIVKATAPIVKAATSTPKAEAPAKSAAPKAPAPAANQTPSNPKPTQAQPKPAAPPAYTGEKSYKSVKSLHRSQFLHALSSIAFPDRSCTIDQELISLVTSEGKNHVAIKFLKANGGIWSSKLSLKDKVYLSAFGSK
ncbi:MULTISPECIES: HAD-IA family hydrolase [Pseudomonas]|uniref:HAD-IA family hydrolase n=1 Tax=Pseudomonas TaxID=286 RepID=UPI00200ADED7|nr:MULTISPECIES: HAD-IA family hydrolase [Pseudomonas]MCK8654852.1 HAD-IA family hydrolase [Pseudomonas umsongensis]